MITAIYFLSTPLTLMSSDRESYIVPTAFNHVLNRYKVQGECRARATILFGKETAMMAQSPDWFQNFKCTWKEDKLTGLSETLPPAIEDYLSLIRPRDWKSTLDQFVKQEDHCIFKDTGVSFSDNWSDTSDAEDESVEEDDGSYSKTMLFCAGPVLTDEVESRLFLQFLRMALEQRLQEGLRPVEGQENFCKFVKQLRGEGTTEVSAKQEEGNLAVDTKGVHDIEDGARGTTELSVKKKDDMRGQESITSKRQTLNESVPPSISDIGEETRETRQVLEVEEVDTRDKTLLLQSSARRSGWDTIFAEPIRWKRKQTIKTCWDHIKYTVLVVLSIMVFLCFSEVPCYLYNVKYGPFVLSEQEIVDTRPGILWKQYIQVHHGNLTALTLAEVECGRNYKSVCKPMLLQFKKRAGHNPRIEQLVVKRPVNENHKSYYVRHPINFSVMSVKKLRAIIDVLGIERYAIPGMEKSDLVSIISKAYDSDPKSFNLATESHVLVGFLTDFWVLNVLKNYTYMDLVLDTSDPYIGAISNTSISAILFCAYFVMKIVHYVFKIAHTLLSSSRLLTSFGSTKFQQRILEPLKHIAESEGWQGINSLSVYNLAALKLQEEVDSDEVFTAVNEKYFRLFVSDKYVIYARNDVADVISVSKVNEIRTWGGSCYVVLSSGQLRTLNIKASHLRSVLSRRSDRFRQLEDERRARRQQQEEESGNLLHRRNLPDEDEQKAKRRQMQDETIRLNYDHFAMLAEAGAERPATRDVVIKMRWSAVTLDEDSEGTCVICQINMNTGERVIKFPCPARHQYHEDCLLQWLKHGRTCPMCRHDLQSTSHRAARVLHLLFL
ncbi:uncharacterized protein LOC144873577 [Branchiostoma floridae x Branchiostoma japonicum]